jgi:hypothetical protein
MVSGDGEMFSNFLPRFLVPRRTTSTPRTIAGDETQIEQPVKPGLPYAAACLLFLRNANRSALIVSASVVGIPCGKPL